jgi:hypothetical protein
MLPASVAPASVDTPVISCRRNQKPARNIAGTSTMSRERMSHTRIWMREVGKSTRYAPMRPAMAPLAPTAVSEAGASQWDRRVAPTPVMR